MHGSFAIPAFAKDSNSTITNISIKVDQNLSKLEAGSSLGNISESDFSTGNTDRYHVDAVQVGGKRQFRCSSCRK